jgi:HEAT repeat protein
MKRVLMMTVVAVLAAGCGEAPPTLSGGKPMSHWVEALRGPDAKLRKTAAFKLGNVGPTDPAVLPALLAALKDNDAGVRSEAIVALMKCGPDAREAVESLTDLRRRDPDARVRNHAARALQKIEDDKAASK